LLLKNDGMASNTVSGRWADGITNVVDRFLSAFLFWRTYKFPVV